MIRNYVCIVILACTPMIAACGSSGGDSASSTDTQSAGSTVVANAGPDQSQAVGSFITLDGTSSKSSKGTGLTYAWTLKTPAGSKATLSNPSVVNPTFTIDVAGIYEASLVVSDGATSSAPDVVLILVNGTPAANAGSGTNGFIRRAVVLDGSKSSDAEGDALSFQWSLMSKPAASNAQLFDTTTVAPSLVPDVSGSYTVQLIVSDGKTNSPPATVQITASPKPPPTVDVGVPAPFQRFITVNTTTVTLDGSASHTNPPGEPLTYLWTITPQGNAPKVSLTSNSNSPQIAQFSPSSDTAGTYVATLTITEPDHPDATLNSATRSVTITIGPLGKFDVYTSTISLNNFLGSCTSTSCNTISVPLGALELDGRGSLVEPLKYAWSLAACPGSTSPGGCKLKFFLTADTTNNARVTTSETGLYTVNLTVTDSAGNTDTRSAKLNAIDGPSITPISINLNGLSVGSVKPGDKALLKATINSGNPDPDCTWDTRETSVTILTITPLTCKLGVDGITADIVATASKSFMPQLSLKDKKNPNFPPVTKSVTFVANFQPSVTVTTTPTITTITTSQGSCLSAQLSATATSGDNFPGRGYTWQWEAIPAVPISFSFVPPGQTATTVATFTVANLGGYSVTATATEVAAPAETKSNSGSRFVGPNPPIGTPPSFRDEKLGQDLYDNGIPNVTKEACAHCHTAGSYDTKTRTEFNGLAPNGPELKGALDKLLSDHLNSTGHTGAVGVSPKRDATPAEITQLKKFLAAVACLSPGNPATGH